MPVVEVQDIRYPTQKSAGFQDRQREWYILGCVQGGVAFVDRAFFLDCPGIHQIKRNIFKAAHIQVHVQRLRAGRKLKTAQLPDRQVFLLHLGVVGHDEAHIQLIGMQACKRGRQSPSHICQAANLYIGGGFRCGEKNFDLWISS